MRCDEGVYRAPREEKSCFHACRWTCVWFPQHHHNTRAIPTSREVGSEHSALKLEKEPWLTRPVGSDVCHLAARRRGTRHRCQAARRAHSSAISPRPPLARSCARRRVAAVPGPLLPILTDRAAPAQLLPLAAPERPMRRAAGASRSTHRQMAIEGALQRARVPQSTLQSPWCLRRVATPGRTIARRAA